MNAVALVGKPNSGKSLLFNSLTGLNQKVTNYPGVTVNAKTGMFGNTQIIDLPGIYSFKSTAADETVSIQHFNKVTGEKSISMVLCILDATNLKASLTVGLEAQSKSLESGIPTVFALNFMDEINANNLNIDVAGLEKALNAKILPISAKTGQGLDELKEFIQNPGLAAMTPPQKTAGSSYAQAQELDKKYGFKSDVLILKQTRFDKFLLSPVIGFLSFVFIMLMLFQAIFTWAVPFMDLVEAGVTGSGEFVTSFLADGIFKDFMTDAMFGGIGSFLVFVPQIFFLTFIISFLEDSGYLARSAIICHKPLSFFGLSGKSFIPFLTAHACAIPAIFAARTIASPRRRFLTILTTPLMSCSARLPVYALLISAIIPSTSYLGGLVGLQGITFFLLYALGIAAALIVSLLISKSKVSKSYTDSAFVLELPSYRMPNLKTLFIKSMQSTWSFISKAGGIIFAVTVIVWVLGYFPSKGDLSTSYLSYLGQLIEPFMEPLGLDWKYGVAILASFLAREVFVGTFGALIGIEAADENIVSLVQAVQDSGLTFASGVALLVFYVIALQCASTLAVMKKELGSYKGPIYIFIGYSVAAYVLALISYQILA